MKTYQEFLAEREYQVYDDSTINEMANLGRETTKLPAIIYVSDCRGVNHGARIKVNASKGAWCGQSFTITISDMPRVIGKTGNIKNSDVETLCDWVILNKEALLNYWNLKIDIATLLTNLKSI